MQKYILPTLIAITAIAVSGTAAFYSITGLSKLFAGAATAVMVMATVLEVSKLVTATLLHNYWKELSISLKSYLTLAVIVLVLITSLGIYGFLTSAYQQTAAKSNIVESEIKLLTINKTFIEKQLEDLLQERSQISMSVSELRSGLSTNKIQYKDSEGNIVTTTSAATRVALEKQLEQSIGRQTDINTQITKLNDELLELNKNIVEIENSSEAAAELGPLKYVAGLTDLPVDRVVNYLILVIIFVFDPLAISLVLAANFAFARLKPREEISNQKTEDSVSYPEALDHITFDKHLEPEFQETLNEMLENEVKNASSEEKLQETNQGVQTIQEIKKEPSVKVDKRRQLTRNAPGDTNKIVY